VGHAGREGGRAIGPMTAADQQGRWGGPDAGSLLGELEALPLPALLARARALREEGHGCVISYSRKVFIPLTRLCRDVCGYCTFAKAPSQVASAYLAPEEVLAIARAGQRAGCKEALFTLGDKPELRYTAAREALAKLGYASTFAYLKAVCSLVLRETGLLAHVNAGVMTEAEIAELRCVSVSQGIMLESIAARLCEKGGPHYGSPDKHPQVRLAMIEAAGRQRIAFTSGILIGIGESRLERIQSLLALRALNDAHGHLQETIIQNFRAKASTRMATACEPGLEDLLWTAAAARLILGPTANIQAPPNLSFADYPRLLDAGINDWGGISPVTADHVNPEAPWPELAKLERATVAAGLVLQQRLAIYPGYARAAGAWVDKTLAGSVLRAADSEGFARDDTWSPGMVGSVPGPSIAGRCDHSLDGLLTRAQTGSRLDEAEIVRLFSARAGDVDAICEAADALRRRVSGEIIRYVVNRNINYTNVCTYGCKFCAFSKGKLSDQLRGTPYDLSLEEVARRALEAWQRGATEVCMQGGIHPRYTGDTYLSLLRAVKQTVPDMHVHAFSPLEIAQGAATLELPVHGYLERLRDAGLGSLPGTAAEILDDEVRAVICPDKLSTRKWLDIIAAAHEVGLPTTSTIMFGHVETPRSWARHLLHLRDLQQRTQGITEFVPLPFVHMEAPMHLRGLARVGPTWREVRLMHAIARLVLHPLITNIQVSWVKLGAEGAASILRGGANDLGGTLMNESISRAAGAEHGQEFEPERIEALIASLGRMAQQRSTLYAPVSAARRAASFGAAPLAPIVQTPLSRQRRAAV
jgi:FO synthase